MNCTKPDTCNHITGYTVYKCRCSECSAAASVYKQGWLSRNNDRHRNRVSARRKEQKERVFALKLERGCDVCGYKKNPTALQYHHRDSSTMSFRIGEGAGRKWEYILREIEKCDLMCANCHWETHYPYTPS